MNNEKDFIWVESLRPKTIDECILPQRIKDRLNEMVNKGVITNYTGVGSPGSGKCLDGSEVIEIFANNEFIDELNKFISKKNIPTTFKELYYDNRANFIRMGVFNDNIPNSYIKWDVVERIYKNPKKMNSDWKLSLIFQNLPHKKSIEFSWLMCEPYEYYLNKVRQRKQVDVRWDWTRIANIEPIKGKEIFETFYNERKVPPKFCNNAMNIQYWLDRGWEQDVAIMKLNELKSSCSCWNTEFWLKKGYSQDEAISKVSEIQKKNSLKGLSKIPMVNRNLATRVEYYLDDANGDIEIAKEMLKKRQSTFSFDKCIQKYGEEKGLEVFADRQYRWQNTLQSNPNIEEINKRKDSISYDFHLKKYGENADEEYMKRLMSISVAKYSQESLEYFKPIIQWAEQNNIPCLYGKSEFSLFCNDTKNLRFYDLTFPTLNVIIEYHGTAFHAKKGRYDWKHPYGRMTYQESIDNDEQSKKLALENGFDYIVLWSDELPEQTQLVEMLNEFL